MKVVQVNELTQKQVLSPTLNPKNSPLGQKKFKITPKLSQNQMPEIKETKKRKDVALYE